MFLRAVNRVNRLLSSSSIPIQNPVDPKPPPGRVGFEFMKDALKWENFPSVVIILGLFGDYIYTKYQGNATTSNLQSLDNAVKELRVEMQSSAKEMRQEVQSSAKEMRVEVQSSAKENRMLVESTAKASRVMEQIIAARQESTAKETREMFQNLLFSLNSSSQRRPYGAYFPPISTPPSRPPAPPQTPNLGPEPNLDT